MKHELLGFAAGHVVDPCIAVAGPWEYFAGGEEELEFAFGGFGAIGTVDEVEGVRDAEVAADCAGIGF